MNIDVCIFTYLLCIAWDHNAEDRPSGILVGQEAHFHETTPGTEVNN